jgi:uncharacterized RDD family membrane protein YckC/Flp pilus assembly protein TadD
VAGALDLCALVALCLGLFLFPLLTRGLVLPMWGVLAAVVGYSVVPLSAFRQTLGMKLVGLELVTKDGHAVSPGDVLFRELIGRGYFPAAFLLTLLLGLIASWLHLMAFVAPVGTTLFFAFACVFGVGFALLGHALMLNREDQRSLADLLSRSYVRPFQAPPPDDDEDERQHRRREKRARVRKVALFELLLFGGALALPWVLTQRTETREEYANRLKTERLETQLKLHPDDEGVASELLSLLRQGGRLERAAEVEKQLEQLHAKKRKEREASLRQRLKDVPDDEEAIGRLLDLLEEDGRADDAVQAYRDFLEHDDQPELRAGFARWLMERDHDADALAELEKAVKAQPTLEGAHALRGELYQRAGKREQALDELYLATLEDPDDDDSQQLLSELEQAGPLSPARRKQLEKQFEAEHKP